MSTSTPGHSGHTLQDDPPLGALVHDLTRQVPQLIRSEIRLAQVELTEKGKRAGLGIGMFGSAGLLAFLGLCCLVVTAILGLAHVVPAWLSALIIGAALLALAGIAALLGKNEVGRATPPAPEHAIAGVKADIATVKGEHR